MFNSKERCQTKVDKIGIIDARVWYCDQGQEWKCPLKEGIDIIFWKFPNWAALEGDKWSAMVYRLGEFFGM